MFFRTKSCGPHTYLQVVDNRWEGGCSRQRVVATMGWLDQLQQNGQLDGLLASGARLARSVLLLSEHAQSRLPTISTRHIGPALVFQWLWQLTGCQHVIQQLLKRRRYIVCRNDDVARTDAADREAIVASLREKVRSGEKSLFGNKGYRRYLSSTGPDHFQFDEAKIETVNHYTRAALIRTSGAKDALSGCHPTCWRSRTHPGPTASQCEGDSVTGWAIECTDQIAVES